MHEQSTKGPCKHPRPDPFDPLNGGFRFWDEAPEITWDAYKSLRDTPPSEAMARYVATVEMENPHWWEVMTAGMDNTRKGALVSSAADCAEEYHDAVKAGILPYEESLATSQRVPNGTAQGSKAANGIAKMLSGILNGDEADPAETPTLEPPEPIAPRGELADFPSLLDDQSVMHTWIPISTIGDEPVPRCGHCVWTKGAREMWVTHGNMNGRKLAGQPKVLDLSTMSWSTKSAHSALDGEVDVADPKADEMREPLARITGASAVLAPNGAAYVFGGAERLESDRGRAKTTRLLDIGAGKKAASMSVRALDLAIEARATTTDASVSKPKRKAEVDSEGNVVAVEASGESPPVSHRTNADAEMEWIDATPYADKENGEHGRDRFTAIAPAPRMLHTATLIGGDVFIFGGVALGPDNAERRDPTDVVLGDLWAYDGAEGSWRCVHRGEKSSAVMSSKSVRGGGEAQLPPADAPPCPRAGHCACAVDDRFLLIWGGDEGEQRGNVDVGVHAFDTWAGRWVAPAVLGEARAPKPRSGAASCVVGTRWFISGGGDGTEARPETHALECRDARAGVFQWTLINSGTKPEDKEAAGKEKASMVGLRAKSGDFLVTFGGFGGFGCSGQTRAMRVSTR